MSYREIATGKYPVTLESIQEQHNVLLAVNADDDVVVDYGYNYVYPTSVPKIPAGKMLSEGAPSRSNNKWHQNWILVDEPQRPVDPTVAFIPLPMLRQRVEKLGLLEPFSAYLFQNPDLTLKLLSTEGQLIDPAYPAILAAFAELNLSQGVQGYLLAPASAGVPDVQSITTG